jgi:hypothetical protein
MRFALIPARLLLAVCLTGPSLVASLAAPDKEGAPATTTASVQANNKKVVRPVKPTWDQCYDMSVNRGFNHDSEEWHQAIVDCLDGKIPF